MADGHLNACKDCVKKRVRKRARTDPAVQAYDRARYAASKKRRQHIRKNAERWRRDNPTAYRAQTAVNNAIRDGRLKKGRCKMCRTTKGVHAHHTDYSKPLVVIWLCAKHHHRLHADER